MQRSISPYTLLFTSVSAILGSGWLFASYYTSKLTGPSALLAWLIGGGAIIIIAFVFAELCALIPVTGSSARIPQYTHGTIVSFMFAWIIWLAYAAFIPTEVQAVLQYLNYFFPSITRANGGLTTLGYFLATLLMLAISALNIVSLRWLLRCNNFLTIMKILIPTVISVIILILFLPSHHIVHPHHSRFMPYGFHGVLAAITSGGIIFAFNGFKQACEMAGEAKNPSRALPFAIIGSILICLTIYLLLQIAFLVSLNVHNLTQGWTHLDLQNNTSPITSILDQDHLSFLLPFLYLGAIIGPLATGLMYMGSSARSLYGMSKNNQIPELFQRLTTQGNPIFAIIVTFILGMCLFAPLPGWNNMISYLTSLMAITYSIAPICLLALRHQIPEYDRPFKLPFATFSSTLAFFICTLLVYWSGWAIISKASIAMLIGLVVLFIHRYLARNTEQPDLNWKSSIWIWPYFFGIIIISYLGNFGGGKNFIPFGWDFATIGIFCIIIMGLAIKFKLPKEITKNYIDQLELTSPIRRHENNHNSKYF